MKIINKKTKSIKKYPLWKRLIGLGLIILAIIWFYSVWISTPSENQNLEETSINWKDVEDMGLSQKLKECGEWCVGKDNIPVIEDECRVMCNNLYYYFGEEELNKYLQEMRE